MNISRTYPNQLSRLYPLHETIQTRNRSAHTQAIPVTLRTQDLLGQTRDLAHLVPAVNAHLLVDDLTPGQGLGHTPVRYHARDLGLALARLCAIISERAADVGLIHLHARVRALCHTLDRHRLLGHVVVDVIVRIQDRHRVLQSAEAEMRPVLDAAPPVVRRQFLDPGLGRTLKHLRQETAGDETPILALYDICICTWVLFSLTMAFLSSTNYYKLPISLVRLCVI